MAVTLKTLVFIAALFYVNSGHSTFDIHNLFHKLDEKPTPLYYCSHSTSGTVWRIPAPLDCPPIKNDTTSRAVDIVFWFQDVTRAALNSFECYKIIHYRRRSHFFFGTYSSEDRNTRKSMTAEECQKMTLKGRSPDNVVLVRLYDSLFSTNKSLAIDYSWPHTNIIEVTNYYYVTQKIFVNNHNNEIISASNLIESCKYTKGHCKTQNGVIVWDPLAFNPCRLIAGEKTRCILTEGKKHSQTRISCPGVNLAMTHISTYGFCGIHLGTNRQGILFSQEKARDILPEIVTTTRLTNIVYRNGRAKRHIPDNEHFKDPSFKSDAQLNGEFQYLFEVLRENTTYALHQIHREVCHSNQIMLELIRSLGAAGMTSLMVRSLLHDPSYRAVQNGDALSIFRCLRVSRYMLLPKSADNCTLEWPVMYMVDGDKYEGWFSGIDHEISNKPTRVPCPSPNFIMDVGNQTIQLSNRSIIVDVPILPSPGGGKTVPDFPDLSWGTPGMYSARDISGTDTLFALNRERSNIESIDVIVSQLQEGTPLLPSQNAVINTITKFAEDRFGGYMFYAMAIFSGVMFLILCAFIAYYTSPLACLCRSFRCTSSV